MKPQADWWRSIFPAGRQTLTITDAHHQPVQIAYGEAGSGQPLLLLHGLGSWSYSWRDIVPPLAQRYRVICLDAKGYGFSDTSTSPETVGHQIAELAQMIQAVSQDPVVLAAESLGALTALAAAQSYPQLIDRLVVINVPIFPQRLPNWGMRSLSYLPLSWVNWIDRRALLRPAAPIVRQLTRWVRQEVVVDPAQITTDDLYWLTYPYLYRSGTLTQFATDLQLAAAEIDRCIRQQPNLISTIQQRLAQVNCPTLVLWAESDRWFPIQDGEALHQALPDARFQLIPNCGHVAAGNPVAVSQAILDFLDSPLHVPITPAPPPTSGNP